MASSTSSSAGWVVRVRNTLAWRGVVDRDPAERWFRERVVRAFAPEKG